MNCRGLTRAERDAIDLAMIDIALADWEAGGRTSSRELRLMRCAYLQGRVDQENGRRLGAAHREPITTGRRT